MSQWIFAAIVLPYQKILSFLAFYLAPAWYIPYLIYQTNGSYLRANKNYRRRVSVTLAKVPDGLKQSTLLCEVPQKKQGLDSANGSSKQRASKKVATLHSPPLLRKYKYSPNRTIMEGHTKV